MFPQSQRELIKTVRGDMSQKLFAKLLDVERSSLSRYESEQLGAPTSVINYCLKALSAQTPQGSFAESPAKCALRHATAAAQLEKADEALGPWHPETGK